MANSYLNRVNSSSTVAQRRQFTISVWVKRSNLGYKAICSSGNGGGSEEFSIRFDTNDKLDIFHYDASSYVGRLITNRVFRDLNAWYHIVFHYDSPNSTAGDRMKLWINGVEETSFSTDTNPTQNDNNAWNVDERHQIGSQSWGNSGNGSNFFDGYISHFANVAGSLVAPTSFGQTDSTSGIWKFKSPSGITWGANGFHLKFENSAALGTDSSGNSNTFTVQGNLKQALDTPSNVYATMNPLIINNFLASTITYAAVTKGNNTLAGTSSSNNGNCFSTLGANSGKFYCEVKATQVASAYPYLGVSPENQLVSVGGNYGVPGYQFTDTVAYQADGNKRINSSTSSFGNTFASGDIIGIAMDLTNGAVYFSKNGTWQNSGDPTSGASKTGAALTFTANDKYYFFGGSVFNTSNSVDWNFGNGFFGTTAITSAGSNGNGSLFEYDVPSGYYALNTKNINTYG